MQALIEGTKKLWAMPTLTILEALHVSTIWSGLFGTSCKTDSKPE